MELLAESSWLATPLAKVVDKVEFDSQFKGITNFNSTCTWEPMIATLKNL